MPKHGGEPKEGLGMEHLTRKLRRSATRRSAAKRALAGLLCATMFGGATALAAEGDTIIAPGFDIAGTGFKNPKIELDYIYYWRDVVLSVIYGGKSSSAYLQPGSAEGAATVRLTAAASGVEVTLSCEVDANGDFCILSHGISR